MTDHIVITDDNATRIIRMNRGDKKNALTQDMYRAMAGAINSAQDSAAIRCLVISGGESVFTAGNDLDDFLKAGRGEAERPGAALEFLTALARNGKPLVGAVEGIAIGVGATMLFHCDHVLASTTATFATPFIQLGLVPEAASSLLVPRVMGHQRAFAMLAMGRAMSAAEAQTAGFVNALVNPGSAETEARKVAQEISALPAEAMAICRRLLRPSPDETLERIAEESALFGERMKSDEAIAAFNAFFTRKKS